MGFEVGEPTANKSFKPSCRTFQSHGVGPEWVRSSVGHHPDLGIRVLPRDSSSFREISMAFPQ